MKLIAHRGNIHGPNPKKENSPLYIENAIKLGYDVEIDLRLELGLYLGHDDPQYLIDRMWLNKFKDKLWIHCKDFSSLTYLSQSGLDLNFFWHHSDDYTLTSKGFIWTYPGKYSSEKSVLVDLNGTTKETQCYGICSDYVRDL